MVTQVSLDEALVRAKLGAMSPPRYGLDGKPLVGKDRARWQAEIVARAESYARWRVEAFLSGVCSHPY